MLGARPVWDEGSDRVSGVEILPIAYLDRPRIDVTLRVSGLFRDVFPSLSALFGQAVRGAGGARRGGGLEPLCRQGGGRAGLWPAARQLWLGHGGLRRKIIREAGRMRAGEAWLSASVPGRSTGRSRCDAGGIAARVAGADGFVHPQDLPETDLLLAADYAAHEAGFAAAQHITGGQAALYHLDATDPDRPRARPLREEIARVVRGTGRAIRTGSQG